MDYLAGTRRRRDLEIGGIEEVRGGGVVGGGWCSVLGSGSKLHSRSGGSTTACQYLIPPASLITLADSCPFLSELANGT